MTTASAPIACRVSAVSLRLSPLDTLEPLAEKLMTSARQPLGGRLERDPGAGGVLEEEVHHGAAAQRRQLLDLAAGQRRPSRAAVSSTSGGGRRGRGRPPRAGACIIAALRPRSTSRTSSASPSISASCTRTLSLERGRDVLADVVGADRQLAGGRGRPARRAGPRAGGRGRAARRARPGRCGRRRARRRPGPPAGRRRRPAGSSVRLQRPGAAQPQVVAVEGDVERADRHVDALEGADPGGQPAGQRHAAGRDAEQDRCRAAPLGLLEDLVGDPVDDAGDVGGVEELRDVTGTSVPPHGTGRCRRRTGRPRRTSFPASRDGSLKDVGADRRTTGTARRSADCRRGPSDRCVAA